MSSAIQDNSTGAADGTANLAGGMVARGTAEYREATALSQDQFTTPVTKDAARLLRKVYAPKFMDGTHFGRGIWHRGDGDFTPMPANPENQPPPVARKGGHRLAYRGLSESALHDHVTGERPHYLMNAATRSWLAWRSLQDVNDLLLRCFPDRYLDDGDVALMDEMMAGRGVSPAQVERLLETGPGSTAGKALLKKSQDESPAVRFRQALLLLPKGTPEYHLLQRQLGRSTELVVEPNLEHELVIDIDAKYLSASAAARQLAERIADEVFRPQGFHVFIEPSRRRAGAYLRFQVYREAYAADDEGAIDGFNRLVDASQRYFRARYGGPKDGLLCHVDKVAGRLISKQTNFDFDRRLYYSQPDWLEPHQMNDGERYEYLKRTEGLRQPQNEWQRRHPVQWAYDVALERYVCVGKTDLITLPLHELLSDADGGDRRLAEYKSFLSDPASAVPQAYLEDLVDLLDEGAIARAPTAVSVVAPLLSFAKSSATRHGAVLDVAATRRDGADRPYEPSSDRSIYLDEAAAQFSRYNAAGRLALRRLGDDDLGLVEEEVLRLVELPEGPATGERHPGREREVRKVVEHWAATFDKSKQGKGDFDAPWFDMDGDFKWAVERVRGRISRQSIQAAQERRPDATLTYEHLAAAFLFMLKNIHTGNVTQVSAKSMIRGLHALGLAGANKITVAALFDLLTAPEAGLIVQVGNANTFPGHARCRAFVLRPTCPIPEWLSCSATPLVHGTTWHAAPAVGFTHPYSPADAITAAQSGLTVHAVDGANAGPATRLASNPCGRLARIHLCAEQSADEQPVTIATSGAGACTLPGAHPVPLGENSMASDGLASGCLAVGETSGPDPLKALIFSNTADLRRPWPQLPGGQSTHAEAS